MGEGRFKAGKLATLTGFGIPTLRNWERRYGLLRPQRMASGHRLYTLDDLSTLRRVKALLDKGWSIREIVSMERETLRDDAASTEPANQHAELQERARPLAEALPYLVLDALPCGVVLTDARGRTQWVNRGLERICGFELSDMQGRTPGSLLQGRRTDPRTVQQLSEAVARGRACAARVLNYAADQREYWADIEIVPLVLGREPRGFVATVRDVTAEVEARHVEA